MFPFYLIVSVFLRTYTFFQARYSNCKIKIEIPFEKTTTSAHTHTHTPDTQNVNAVTITVARTQHMKLKIFSEMWSQIDGIELSLVKMKLIKIENTHCERDRKWLVPMCLCDYRRVCLCGLGLQCVVHGHRRPCAR